MDLNDKIQELSIAYNVISQCYNNNIIDDRILNIQKSLNNLNEILNLAGRLSQKEVI